MLIQKTVHLQMARDEAKAKLSDVRGYFCRFADIEMLAVGPDGTLHLRFGLPCGFYTFRGKTDILEVESANPDETLFRSCGGNVELVGMVEYFEIKPNLTEVVLTVDYRVGSPVVRAVDFALNSVNRLLNRELRRLEDWFEQPGGRTPSHPNLGKPLNGHPAPGKPV